MSGSFGIAKPIICSPRTEIDGIRLALGFQNLYRVKVRDAVQYWLMAPIEDRNDKASLCPLKGPSTRCGLVRCFPDNYEWNEYAMIALRFGLFKHPLWKVMRFRTGIIKYAVERKFGSLGDRVTRTKELSKILSNLEPQQLRLEESRTEFFPKFVPVGVGVALFCFALEIWLGYISRLLSQRRRVPHCFLHCRVSPGSVPYGTSTVPIKPR